MSMRIKVSEDIYLSFHSSNIDGRGKWGSVWIESDDLDEGKVVLDDREDIRKLIKALKEAIEQIAVDSGNGGGNRNGND